MAKNSAPKPRIRAKSVSPRSSNNAPKPRIKAKSAGGAIPAKNRAISSSSSSRRTGGLKPFPESQAERDAFRKARDNAARSAARSAARKIAGKTGGVATALLTPDTVQAATLRPQGKETRSKEELKRYTGSEGLRNAQESRRKAVMDSAPKPRSSVSSSTMSPSRTRAKKPTLTKAEIDKSMKAFEAMTPEMPAKSSSRKMPSVRATAARSSVSGNRMSPKPTAKKRTTTPTGVTKPKSVKRGTARTPDSERAVKTVKTKGGDYKVYKKDSAQAKSFRKAYADAVAKRKELGKKAGTYIFDWNGKKYKA